MEMESLFSVVHCYNWKKREVIIISGIKW
jgi:hypothetical protein